VIPNELLIMDADPSQREQAKKVDFGQTIRLSRHGWMPAALASRPLFCWRSSQWMNPSRPSSRMPKRPQTGLRRP
jgi:hypothetical protein